MRAVALLVLAAVLLPAAPLPAAVAQVTTLRISYWENGLAGPRRTWTLRCDPARGTLPRPMTACRRLAAGGRALFAPVPRDAVCTAIYGGPDVARVVGTLAGRRVWATFRLVNGCHIDRWNRLAPWLLPRP